MAKSKDYQYVNILRVDGTAMVQHMHDFTPPPDMQEMADRFIAQVLKVEKKTGTHFDNRIKVDGRPGHISVDCYPGEEARPQLKVGADFFSSSGKFADVEKEAILLHEMGHQHYHPLREHYDYEHDVRKLLDGVRRLQKQMADDPARTATRIVKAFNNDESWAQEGLAAVGTLLDTRYQGIKDDVLMQKPQDSMVASWLLADHKRITQGGGPPSPLEVYAQLPRMTQDEFDASDRFGRAAQWPVYDKDILPSDAVERVKSSLMKLEEKLVPRLRACRTLLRGEEHLCDDYAVVRCDEPHALGSALSTTNMRRMLNGVEERDPETHPTDLDRLERIMALADRVEKARAASGASPDMMDAAEYKGWADQFASSRGMGRIKNV